MKTLTTGKYYAELMSLQIPYNLQPYFGVAGPGLIPNVIGGGFGEWDSKALTWQNAGIDPRNETSTIIGLGFDADTKELKVWANDTDVSSEVGTSNTFNSPYSFMYTPWGDGQLTPDIAYNFGQQGFAYAEHDRENCTATRDGVVYQTLYDALDTYQVSGGYFYDEKNQEAVRGSDLQKRYGITSADPRLGIYELTEAPGSVVIGYEKVGDKYRPLRDYRPDVDVVESELTAAQATIRQQREMIIRAACGWVIGKAYNEGDIIIFNGHVFEATAATTATADNDPGDETGDWKFLGLEEDSAPTTINGYYPLFTTEAAADAAGNGSSHAHTFDGVTYYMPDAGTTIYHGTYGGYSY